MMGANVKAMMTGDSKVVVAKLAMAGMQSAPAFEKGSVVESVSGNELPAMEPMGADMEPDPAGDAVARAKTHPAMRAEAAVAAAFPGPSGAGQAKGEDGNKYNHRGHCSPYHLRAPFCFGLHY